ncbi:MAG: ABC transporter permease [Caldilineaceae bacterium]|nr:ABC transporter permease [Caldilineaceae bacterium]
MAEIALPASPGASSEDERKEPSAAVRLIRYTLVKTITLFITVVIGVYLTIIIANMGGQVDEIRRGVIRENVAIQIGLNPALKELTTQERSEYAAKMVALQEKRLGLDQPFFIRSFRYLYDALTLNLGRAENISSDSGSRQVRLILLERLPPTLLLFASSQLFLFFGSLFIALALSRNYGSWFDRLIVAMAPTSAAPSWFYGLFFILIFAAIWGVLPYGGMVGAPPPADTINYALSVLKHLTLPVAAIVISAIFFSIYSSRTFFLIYSSEDYVEMAQAKGLSSRAIERRYILRPTLPTIVTSLALTVIGLWQGAVVLETVFNWPGLGRLLYQAASVVDTPIIVGGVVIYAYLLAITVFLLDIVYALLDPRVKVGGGSKA